jgi:hypothetical protein
MGLAELKQAADEFPTDERLELAAHIRQSFRVDDPSWQAEMERRLSDCLQGKGHSAAALLALHDRLCASGR